MADKYREETDSECNEGHDDEDNQDEPQPELGGLVRAGTCIETAESYRDHTDYLHRQMAVLSHLTTVQSHQLSRSDQAKDSHRF